MESFHFNCTLKKHTTVRTIDLAEADLYGTLVHFRRGQAVLQVDCNHSVSKMWKFSTRNVQKTF
jgi:hypothetical protein